MNFRSWLSAVCVVLLCTPGTFTSQLNLIVLLKMGRCMSGVFRFSILNSWILLICGVHSREVGQFWHVTDFHYDHTYGTTGLSCNEQVNMTGYYGDYWCDSPWTLIETSVNNMKALKADPDFIIWTGDTVAHIKDEYLNLKINLEILRNITEILTAAFPNTTVYATLGNHDFYPSDNSREYDEKFFGSVADMWSHWIDDANQTDLFKKGGYYYKELSPKIRLFGLNTNFYYSANPLTENITDPAGQYEWLEEKLTETRSLGMKAIITGHVTPGLLAPEFVEWMYPQHRRRFINILMEFNDVIIATHFGHDHSDNFKLLQGEDGSNPVLQFVAPSVTPWRYKAGNKSGDPHNPGIRLVNFDRDTGDHLDYTQYYINLTDSNVNRRADWKKLYTFTEAYNVADMSIQSVKNIYKRMNKLENPDAKKFCQYALVSGTPQYCPDEYQAAIYCSGVHLWLDDAERCKHHMIHGDAGNEDGRKGGGGGNGAGIHSSLKVLYITILMCLILLL